MENDCMIVARRLRPAGFTMIEILIVISIIGILAALLLPTISRARAKARESAAKQAMSAIAMALDKYRDDFGRYPPHDKPMGQYGIPQGDQVGSEVLYYYLCTRFKTGESYAGPYMDNVSESRLKETGGTIVKELMSPLGGYYRYTLIREKTQEGDTISRRCLAVDAGLDNLWGGDVDEAQGWFSDNVDMNNDGSPDDKDNINSSTVITKK
jgi:prepilin-type N-terminal cleavage/methylation domain-containing protein